MLPKLEAIPNLVAISKFGSENRKIAIKVA